MQNHHRAVSFDTLTGNDSNLFCVVEQSITETFCVYKYKAQTTTRESAFRNR